MTNTEKTSLVDVLKIPEIAQNIKAERNFKGRRKWDKTIYRKCICAFDIETTYENEIEQSFMYIWQFAMMDLETEQIFYCYNRTWNSFVNLIEQLNDTYLSTLIFVHNLSYEFQFFRHWLELTEVFALKSRKILSCKSNNVVFRCSYLQTNKSLGKFTNDMKVTHSKLSGEKFDYSKKRFPWTTMTKYELAYSCNDVIGLVEAMKKRMDNDNDTLYSLPLTSTGYVRRKAKLAMKSFNYKQLHEMFFDENVYILLRNEFRGGDTHANRYHSNKILKNVDSWDRASSYPDVMLNCEFPMSNFVPRLINNMEELLTLCKKRHMCFIGKFILTNVRQKDVFYGAPYISKDKALELTEPVCDNGRVLSCDRIVLSLTDIDYKIIKSEYNFDIEVVTVFTAKYSFLPTGLRNLVIDLFKDKTELKGIEEKEVDYMKSKELINSLYGMCAQNPIRPEIIYNDGESPFSVEPVQDLHEAMEKHNKKAFLSYAWGCWVTCWARYYLKLMINIVGDNFVYCDTDSVKFVISDDYNIILNKIEKLNNEIKERSIKNKGYATDSFDKTHYLGVYEQEKKYKKFKTLGAKKYAYEYEDGKFGITIAGVPKKEGAKELKTLENFKIGFVFSNSGKLESRYNDLDYGMYNPDGQEGHDIDIRSNIVLRPTTYEIGITDEYSRVLMDAENWNLFKETERMKRL